MHKSKNQNKICNMQFLQLFSVLILLLVHFDCSQARLTRSSPIEDPLQPGYKRQRAKKAMKKGAKAGAAMGALSGAVAGSYVGGILGTAGGPLGTVGGAAAGIAGGAVAGTAVGAGVGGAVGAAVGTIKGFREQKKAKKAIAAITGKQQSNEPTGL
jgi:hypothetical protein